MARPEVKVRITAQNDTATGIRSATSSVVRLQSTVAKLGAAFGIGLSAKVAFDFFRSTVAESNAADAALAQVRTSVQNAGKSFDEWRPRIDEAAVQLQRITRFGDDEGREALAGLITITKDVSRSIENLGLVADIASARKLSLKSASDLVGRAMIGETSMLKRYGIVVKEGENAIESMRKTFQGFAENEGTTTLGKTAKLKNAFSDLKEEIGNVINRQEALGGVLPTLQSAIEKQTKSINENADAIARNLKLGAAGLMGIVSTIGALAKIAFNLTTMLAGLLSKTIADVVVFAGNLINALLIRPINGILDAVESLAGIDVVRPVQIPVDAAATFSRKAAESVIVDMKDIGNAVTGTMRLYKDLYAVINAPTQASQTKTPGAGGAPTDDDPVTERSKEQAKAIKSVIDKLREEAATAGLDDAAKLRWALTTQGATEAEIKFAEALRRRRNAMNLLDENKTGPMQITTRPALAIRGGMMEPTEAGRPAASVLGVISQEQERINEAMDGIRDQLADGLGNSLADGIANGFAAALSKGGIQAGFKALAETLLTGLGNAMVQFGKASLLASTLMQRIKESLASLNPVAGVAASLTMIAIGGLLGGAASAAFGGGGGASGYSTRGLSDTVTRVTVASSSPNAAAASKVEPVQVVVQQSFTVLGSKSPEAVRWISDASNEGAQRGLKFGVARRGA